MTGRPFLEAGLECVRVDGAGNVESGSEPSRIAAAAGKMQLLIGGRRNRIRRSGGDFARRPLQNAARPCLEPVEKRDVHQAVSTS